MLIKAMRTIGHPSVTMSGGEYAVVADHLAQDLIDAGAALEVAEAHPTELVLKAPLTEEQIQRIHKACPDVCPGMSISSPLRRAIIKAATVETTEAA